MPNLDQELQGSCVSYARIDLRNLFPPSCMGYTADWYHRTVQSDKEGSFREILPKIPRWSSILTALLLSSQILLFARRQRSNLCIPKADAYSLAWLGDNRSSKSKCSAFCARSKVDW